MSPRKRRPGSSAPTPDASVRVRKEMEAAKGVEGYGFAPRKMSAASAGHVPSSYRIGSTPIGFQRLSPYLKSWFAWRESLWKLTCCWFSERSIRSYVFGPGVF